MRRTLLVSLVWGLIATGAARGATSRGDCIDACAVRIAECASTCGDFAPMGNACRRGVLKRCQREGVGVCAVATTSTTATTSAPTSSTTHATTTTTHGPTTSTTTPSGLSCAMPRPLALGTVVGNTSSGSDHGPGVGCMQNAEAPDLIYVIVPGADGTLVLSLTSAWDGGLYVRTACDEPATELACVDVLGDDATEVLQLGVTAGTPYYVYVDGYTSDSYGEYELTSELQ